MLYRFNLYLNTLRYLKPSQIFWRIYYRLVKPEVSHSGLPEQTEVYPEKWFISIYKDNSMCKGGQFKFLNETHEVNTPLDWNNTHYSKLWLYNLHYFDCLLSRSEDGSVQYQHGLIKRWIDENPVGEGNGWEPYPLSLRIVNWIKWAYLYQQLDEYQRTSLALQTACLYSQLEYHLLGNHLLANAKALIFSGCFYQGPVADEWLASGIKILFHEIDEQVLEDGGHFELSPMYHAIILEDFLDIYYLLQLVEKKNSGDAVSRMQPVIQRMLTWMKHLVHPDGEIVFFNDATFKVSAQYQSLCSYARRVGIDVDDEVESRVNLLSDSGYIHLNDTTVNLYLDVAEVGASYIPGHAHADTLSFEMSLFDQRFLVNTGTSIYDVGAQRSYERSTSAHNTVCINDKNSSEVWGGFRVAQRASTYNLEILEDNDFIQVSCEHDGYMRLKPGMVHRRTWKLGKNSLSIVDEISGKFENAEGFFHFHPSVTVEPGSVSGQIDMVLPDSKCVTLVIDGADIFLEDDEWHPEFALSLDSKKIRLRLDGPWCKAQFSW